MNDLPSPPGGEGQGEGETIFSSPPHYSSPLKGEESFFGVGYPAALLRGYSF